MDEAVGFQRIPVADFAKAIHAAGTPIALYGFNIITEVTGSGPNLLFYNDSDGSTNEVLIVHVTADIPTTVMFPEAIVFPNGCFVDVSGVPNTVQATFFYQTLR